MKNKNQNYPKLERPQNVISLLKNTIFKLIKFHIVTKNQTLLRNMENYEKYNVATALIENRPYNNFLFNFRNSDSEYYSWLIDK